MNPAPTTIHCGPADLAAFRDGPAWGRPLLGLDPGQVTIGLSVCDPGWRVASPLAVLRQGKFTTVAAEISALADERGAGGLVIGLPVNMNGTEGPRCQSARQFAANLVGGAGWRWPILFWDERLSTRAVTRVLRDEADLSRRRRAQLVDKLAAVYILQGMIDAIRHLTEREQRQGSQSARPG